MKRAGGPDLLTGDCVEVMAALEPASVDAVVTDPPYDLGEPRSSVGINMLRQRSDATKARRRGGFMGKAWDGTGIAFDPATWAAMLRLARPGAYLLAFGGTRTYHRMTCAIEDAGWIIRDCLVWAYASGFPKSRALLKPAWEPIVMARKPGPLRELGIDACRIGTGEGGDREGEPSAARRYGANGIGLQPTPGPRGGASTGRWPANVILTDPIFDGDTPGVVGGGETGISSGGRILSSRFPMDVLAGKNVSEPGDPGYGDTGTYSRFFLIPKADRAEREPVMGGLAVQHAGIGIRAAEPGEYEDFVHAAPDGIGAWLRRHREVAGMSAKALCEAIGAHGAVNHGGAVSNWEQELNRPTPDQWRRLRDVLRFDDRYDEVMTTIRTVPRSLMEGGPARRANHHPTVKPLDLMRHLVRLVTPTDGTVLDPFAGSGTTLLAAEMEGFRWIGIEREPEYVAIAEARLNGTQRGMGLPA